MNRFRGRIAISNSSGPTLTGNHGGRLVRRRFLAGLALASVAAVVACGTGGSAPSSNDSSASTAVARVSTGMGSLAAAGQSASSIVVKMTGQNTFDPAIVTVPIGSSVTWLDDATTPKSVTCDPAFAATKGDIVLPAGASPFDSGMIAPGQIWTHSFTTPGTYKYACVPNEAAGMRGTVVVS
jgi:plastocyanin